MNLIPSAVIRAARAAAVCLAAVAFACLAFAQGVTTTTVQGTVYLANGQPGSGTLQLSWPAFTTANNLAVAAGRTTVPIGSDGFISVNLTPNLGASPAGLFYTAVYHMSDGATSTEYWVVPAAAQVSIAAVRAQVMPAAQAVQAVSKAYVDQAIQSLAQGSLTPVGGTLSSPLYLSGDPTQALQAADKHYVDATFAQALPLSGGAATGPLTATQLGGAYQVDQFPGADFGARLQACLNGLSSANGGACDARNFTGAQSMASTVTIAKANATVLLPCATITTAAQIVVTAGTRNVSLRGCSLRGSSAASGTQGGTVFQYTGASAMFQIGDPTYAADTQGFHLDNAVINTTGAASSTAQPLVAYRTQELDLQSLYLLGNSNQTGMTLDGTGNYTGGTFYDNAFTGFLTAVNAIGHQSANPATTDWMNASTFVRLHINCPTASGSPIAGTTGVNLAQGDGNTFTGGDVEGCDTALHLGPNAVNNTIVGLRNENSNSQVVADKGSAYNNWITGGTMFTGELTDNGSQNSFWDAFHRTINGVKGDWYASQQDTTLTDHQRLGTGLGNERGRVTEYQTDYGYRWTTGLGDGTTGAQFYSVTDLLNNVQRLSIGQYLSATPNSVTNVIVNNGGCFSSSAPPLIAFTGGGGSGAAAAATMAPSTSLSCPGGYTVSGVSMTANGSGYTGQPALSFTGSNLTAAPHAVAEITPSGSTNNQTVLNAAGTGAVVLNGSNNSGTGGVVFGSGGPSETTVATVDNAGDAQFNGTLRVGGASTFTSTTTVRNSADAEIDSVLQAGAANNQKESFIYKDNTGASQWYMVKDTSNNWALNSAPGNIDSLKAYQSTNSGDTYINASNSGGVVRVNYEPGSGSQFKVYGGNNGAPYASFTGATAIQFPGLAAASGLNCLQVDNSGYLSNTGSSCGTGAGSTNGTINSGTSGQIAYYSANGSTVSGMSAIPVSAGGTGATTAAAALAALGAASLTASAPQLFASAVSAPSVNNVTEASQYPTFAAAVAATPAGGRLHLASSYLGGITSTINIANPITFQCDAGATIQRQTGPSSVALNITAPNVVFDGCTFDANGTPMGGVLADVNVRSSATGFQFRNGSFINTATYGLELFGTINTVIDNNLFQAVAVGTSWGAGITSTGTSSQMTQNLRITANRFQPGDVNIQSQQCPRCGTNTFVFSNNVGTPTPGAASMLLQVQDTTWDQSGLINNFTVTGNVCNISAATPSAAPFGCFSIVANTTNCTISGNTLNGAGQYFSDSLLELGATHCTVSNNTFTAGNDPGAQGYNDLIAYGGPNTFSGNVFNGISSYGGALTIYALANADDNTISGGSITAGNTFAAQIYSQSAGSGYSGTGTCTVNGGVYQAPALCTATVNNGGLSFALTYGGQYTTAPTSITTSFTTSGAPATVSIGAANATSGINATCNRNSTSLTATVTGISGNGSTGPVAALAINSGTGDPPIGRYWTTSSGNSVSGGSGTGLQLDITSTDAQGTVRAVAPSGGHAGNGYKLGDHIALTASGPEQVGSILDLNIGGGLAISGAFARGLNIQSMPGPSVCPVEADISNISIAGPSSTQPMPTGIYGYQSKIAEGKIRFVNVATPNVNAVNTVKYETISMANPVQTPSVALTGLAPSGAKLCASGPNGEITNVGCDQANGSTFTPTATGWYRILSASANQIGGAIDIDTMAYDNHEIHDRFEFVGSGNGNPSVLSAALLSTYGGSYGPIDQVEVSGNNSSGIYVDVHVNDIANPQPITITYGGQSLPQSAVIASPVVGATPGAYSVALINLSTLTTAPPVTRKTTGQDEASNYNAISGYLVNGTPLAAAHLSNGATGSGNVVLSTGPTFKGNTTTFANGSAAEQDIILQPGASADQTGAFQWSSYSGTAQWKLRKDASNYLRLTDSVNSLDRAVFYQNGQSILNAGAGSNAVVLNGSTNSGTGGLLVQNGGSSPATVLTVTGSGNTTATGFIAGKSLTGTGAMTIAAGAAAGSSPTVACSSSHLCDGVSGAISLTTGSSPTTGTLATLTFPSARTNSANCVVNASSAGAQLTSITWNETASALTLTANAALSASTPYQIRYWCGGN